jgi:hypothetical protein
MYSGNSEILLIDLEQRASPTILGLRRVHRVPAAGGLTYWAGLFLPTVEVQKLLFMIRRRPDLHDRPFHSDRAT